MTTAAHETHDSPADQPRETKKRKPDFTDEAWTGRGRYLRIACWDEEVTLDNGGSFLSHRTRIVSGYVQDGEYVDGEPIWIQGGQALRLSVMLAGLDSHETASEKQYRRERKESSQ